MRMGIWLNLSIIGVAFLTALTIWAVNAHNITVRDAAVLNLTGSLAQSEAQREAAVAELAGMVMEAEAAAVANQIAAGQAAALHTLAGKNFVPSAMGGQSGENQQFTSSIALRDPTRTPTPTPTPTAAPFAARLVSFSLQAPTATPTYTPTATPPLPAPLENSMYRAVLLAEEALGDIRGDGLTGRQVDAKIDERVEEWALTEHDETLVPGHKLQIVTRDNPGAMSELMFTHLAQLAEGEHSEQRGLLVGSTAGGWPTVAGYTMTFTNTDGEMGDVEFLENSDIDARIADWAETDDTADIPASKLPDATTSAPGAMSGADKTKLDGIAAGAEVNVNADWNATSGDAQILNKPPIPTGVVNAVTFDTTGLTAGDTGEFLVWNDATSGWDNADFKDANGYNWNFDATTDQWVLDGGVEVKAARPANTDGYAQGDIIFVSGAGFYAVSSSGTADSNVLDVTGWTPSHQQGFTTIVGFDANPDTEREFGARPAGFPTGILSLYSDSSNRLWLEAEHNVFDRTAGVRVQIGSDTWNLNFAQNIAKRATGSYEQYFSGGSSAQPFTSGTPLSFTITALGGATPFSRTGYHWQLIDPIPTAPASWAVAGQPYPAAPASTPTPLTTLPDEFVIGDRYVLVDADDFQPWYVAEDQKRDVAE